MNARNGLLALTLFILALAGVASAQTRTFTLANGDSLTPASPVQDASGVTTYYGGFVNGQVTGPTVGTFTLAVTFTGSQVVEATAGIFSGSVVAPGSSFAISQISGRKSVTTSGTIDSGTVTYRLVGGRAEIISVVSDNLVVWEGKNRRRTVVATGSLNYGVPVEGEGDLSLFYQ
jgi:hypothetical protein